MSSLYVAPAYIAPRHRLDNLWPDQLTVIFFGCAAAVFLRVSINMPFS